MAPLERLKTIAKFKKIPPLTGVHCPPAANLTCSVFVNEKLIRASYNTIESRFYEHHFRISVDTIGPVYPMSSGAHSYILTMIDVESCLKTEIPIPSRAAVTRIIILAMNEMRRQYPHHTIALHTENAAIFRGSAIKKAMQLIGVQIEDTLAHEPEQNALAER